MFIKLNWTYEQISMVEMSMEGNGKEPKVKDALEEGKEE